ncbi:MAG: hypothetical protein ACE5H4_11560 [Candidatus Thorarchaeota archaeon]
MRRELEPSKPTGENLYKSSATTHSLPGPLKDELEQLGRSKLISRTIGESLIGAVTKLRTAEWKDYMDTTGNPGISEETDWEIERYLYFN